MIKDIVSALERYISNLEDSTLKEATEYALLAGGKRIRPLLMLQVIEHYKLHPLDYVDAAISLELLHTYSLVHDDLPAMDDDTLRRGKPTLHIAFDEGLAILVGDGLLTDSFKQISSHPLLTDTQKIKMIDVLSSKTGSKGMVYGQVLDLASEKQSISKDRLDQLYLFKTAYLLQASLMLGAIASNQIETIELWEKLGYHLGIYFQIQDDILEHTSSPEVLGKSKTDDIREKPTYVSLIGLDESHNALNHHEIQIDHYVHQLDIKNSMITQSINEIKKRKA
ncbi:MAG: polyprenyl synthetase family protein [Firmicutes bacterium]|nr:polyprenyl synthetase family protein [Bacillota bacterium]